MTNPSVCLVILNYNGRRLLERFLPSLTKTDYQPLEVVVVDNASVDDSVSWLRSHYPQVTLLQSQKNLAWAGGNNIGIRYALAKGHRYIVLANNDIEPHQAWISRAVQFAIEHPKAGIIGYELFNEEREFAAYEQASRTLSPLSGKPVEQVVGCAMFCDSDLFRGIGLFDEVYWIYAEESDFEWRALQAGCRMYEINTPVWHMGEATMRRMAWKRAYLQMRNSIRLDFKLRGVAAGLRTCKTVLNRACNPWLRLQVTEDYTLNRYRPSNLLVNASLACTAVAWNFLRISQTLRAGHRDQLQIKQYLSKSSI